jgi:hypothetical protein
MNSGANGNKTDVPEEKNVYALMIPSDSGWKYRVTKSMGIRTNYEMSLPRKAFAAIPVSEIFDRVSNILPTTSPRRTH